MDTQLSKCLPLKVTGKLRVSIKDKDNVTIAKNLYLPDAQYIVEVVNKYAALEARLKEAEAKTNIREVYEKHLVKAKAANFSACGCDYCEAYRADGGIAE